MTAQSIATCSGYDLYLEALEWYALLDRELTVYDSIKPRTMVLATANPSGRISARNMTISSYGKHGFVFFSNASSRKGLDLQGNANAALCAYWHPLKQQVSIEGIVHAVDDETADAHWTNRTREYQARE